jgi:cytoskeleton protein RodZ
MTYNEKELMEKLEREKSATVLPPKKETIGEVLAKARAASKKDVAYISDYLKIKPQYLRALEEDKFSSLPGQAYVIGFIKSYASFLNLDVGKLIEQYKAEHAPSRPEAEPVAESEDALIKNPLINSNHIIVFGLLFLMGVFAVYAFNHGGGALEPEAVVVESESESIEITIEQPAVPPNAAREADGPDSESRESGAVQRDARERPSPSFAPVPPPVHADIVGDAPPAPAPVPAAPHVRPVREHGRENAGSGIRLVARDRVWIKLKRGGLYRYDEQEGDVGDGETVFETILEPGDSYDVPDGSGLFLTIGNAQAVDIIVEGEAVPPLSPRAISRFNIEMDAGKLKDGTAYVRTRGRE